MKTAFVDLTRLNTAELKIINAFYTARKAELLWDADVYYLNDKNQEAGYFYDRTLNALARTHQILPAIILQDQTGGGCFGTRTTGRAQVVRQSLEAWMKKAWRPKKIAVVLASETLYGRYSGNFLKK